MVRAGRRRIKASWMPSMQYRFYASNKENPTLHSFLIDEGIDAALKIVTDYLVSIGHRSTDPEFRQIIESAMTTVPVKNKAAKLKPSLKVPQIVKIEALKAEPVLVARFETEMNGSPFEHKEIVNDSVFQEEIVQPQSPIMAPPVPKPVVKELNQAEKDQEKHRIYLAEVARLGMDVRTSSTNTPTPDKKISRIRPTDEVLEDE